MNIQNWVSAFGTKKALVILAGILVLCSIVAGVFVATSHSSPSSAAAAIIGFTSSAPVTAGAQVSVGPLVRAGTYTIEPSVPPPFYDYMVPDVCLDGSGNPTSQDPATCTKKRNLRIGESLPYLLSDFAARTPGWNQPYQYSTPFPILYGKDVRVVQGRDFGANSGHPGAFRDFDTAIDGYDILSSNGSYVSAIGTRDPTTNTPDFFWVKPDCTPSDSWVFFPITLTKGSTSFADVLLKGWSRIKEGPCAPTTGSVSHTDWNWYAYPLPYTSGKQLESIQSWHHNNGGADPDATKKLIQLEVFRFTKEYGLTRWEGWESEAGAKLLHNETLAQLIKKTEDYTFSQICDAGAPIDRFGTMMYRWGCRDWSFVFPVDEKRGPVTPYSLPLIDGFGTSHNLLSSNETVGRADAANSSLLGWNTQTVGGGKAATLSTGSDPLTATNVPSADNPTPGNKYYVLKCTEACGLANARTAYMDVNPNAEITAYGTKSLVVQAGALVRGPAKAEDMAVVVHMIDSAGKLIASRFVDVTASAATFTGRVNSLTVTPTTATSTGRLTVTWSALGAVKTIPLGSKVLIGRTVYTTNVNTGVGVIYLPPTTTGITVGDYVKYIEGPDGTVIYTDIGTTSTANKWQQVRFNFDWDFAAQPVSKMRYEIYVRSPGEYQFDEAFLALLPRDPKLPVVTVTTTPVVATTTATTTGTTATTTPPNTATTTTTTVPTTGTATTTTSPGTSVATTTTTVPTTTTPPTTTGDTTRPVRSVTQ